MRALLWMIGASVSTAAVAVAVLGPRPGLDVLLGMAGPLAVACGSWVAMERTYRREPQRLTALMGAAFLGKLVFFGAYVAVALKVLAVQPVPFVVSFSGYFIALHVAEALCLRRLFAGDTRESR